MPALPPDSSDSPPPSVTRSSREDGEAALPAPAGARPLAWRTNALLFAATIASVLYTQYRSEEAPLAFRHACQFTGALLAILLAHEFGHYIAARIHKVDASLPFFIPFPPWFGLGTMGAVIGMRRVTSDRKKLIDIGAAGPLAGLCVAIPVILYGLAHSKVGPLVPHGELEGNSLLYAVLKHASKGLWLPDGHQDVYLHPTAYAGWAGLLVTMINLLPIGQLDGGHVATAYFGNRYNVFARRLHALMPLVGVGVFVWVRHLVRVEMGAHYTEGFGVNVALVAALPWLVWFMLVGFVRRAGGGMNHPPVQRKPLPASRKALFWLMVVVFIAIFMPVPIRESFTGEVPDAPAVTAVDP